MTAIAMTYCKICTWATLVWNEFVDHAEAFGRARAAAELSRLGHHKEAQELMLRK